MTMTNDRRDILLDTPYDEKGEPIGILLSRCYSVGLPENINSVDDYMHANKEIMAIFSVVSQNQAIWSGIHKSLEAEAEAIRNEAISASVEKTATKQKAIADAALSPEMKEALNRAEVMHTLLTKALTYLTSVREVVENGFYALKMKNYDRNTQWQ